MKRGRVGAALLAARDAYQLGSTPERELANAVAAGRVKPPPRTVAQRARGTVVALRTYRALLRVPVLPAVVAAAAVGVLVGAVLVLALVAAARES